VISVSADHCIPDRGDRDRREENLRPAVDGSDSGRALTDSLPALSPSKGL